MAGKIVNPRKRRTRQHVIADQSVHHVQGLILDEGFTSEIFARDYGYDLQMVTFDAEGYLEPGLTYFQIKASDHLTKVGRDYIFDLDIRDYNLWIYEHTQVILVLYDAIHRRAYWLDVRRYFAENDECRPSVGARFVRVRIPQRRRLTWRTIAYLRRQKFESK